MHYGFLLPALSSLHSQIFLHSWWNLVTDNVEFSYLVSLPDSVLEFCKNREINFAEFRPERV